MNAAQREGARAVLNGFSLTWLLMEMLARSAAPPRVAPAPTPVPAPDPRLVRAQAAAARAFHESLTSDGIDASEQHL